MRELDTLTAPDVDGQLICRAVLPVTHDVKTFVLGAPSPRLFSFQPGQYLTVTTPAGSRCYTISSPPTRPHLVAITVKRSPGGAVSNWLHDKLRPGDRISAEGPYGRFSCAAHPARSYLFLSAGSGITPLMSMTRTLFDLASVADVTFVHSARTPADVIFKRELTAMAAVSPRLRLAFVCEDAPGGWHGYRGRLSPGMLHSIAPDLPSHEVFACGPDGYMKSVRAMLGEAGFDLRRYHEESFTFEKLAGAPGAAAAPVPVSASVSGPVPAPSPAAPAATFSVEFVRSGWTVPCEPGMYILDAALRAGLTLPSSCGEGMCGTCKSTLVSGSVDMSHNGGIRPREIAAHKILLCCSTPLEDLVIDA
jgi:glycine betaine catabolism B